MKTHRFFDISKLRPFGGHYVGLAFDLRYNLHLPPSHYEVSLSVAKRTAVSLVQIQSWRRKTDREGLLVPEEQVEKYVDREGTFLYTSVIVYLPIRAPDPETNQDRDKVWEQVCKRHQMLLGQAILVINRMLSIYRFETGEYHIRPLAGDNTWFDHALALVFLDYIQPNGDAEATILYQEYFDSYRIGPVKPPVPADTQTRFQKKLISDFQVPLWEDLILNAYDFLDQGNNRLTIIEVEVAFEAALLYIFEKHRPDNRAFKINSPGKMMKNRRFQQALIKSGKKWDKDSELYQEWRSKVWNVRNGIVHGNMRDVSHHTAKSALDVVEDNLEYLLDRAKTRP